jgi:OOP family OmpA-OmpF porin
MKKILAVALAFCTFSTSMTAQDEDLIRRPALGLSFFFNDFVTPDRIKASSVSGVFRDGKWARFKEMKAGIAVHYFQGLRKHVDFSGTIAGSFLRYPMPNKNFTNDNLLLEADAALNLKMLTERYWMQPYIHIGVGASWYRKYWGAFMPIGLGLKMNLYDETHLFITGQYRTPVTTETSAHHFFYNIGIASAIGKKKEPKVIPPPPPPPPVAPADTDGDGIVDPDDKCPTVKGVAKYQGCPVPDTDKDGIDDDNDKCIDVPGVARYQGCPIPDTDKDGLNDEDDKCPTVPGVARYQGCPVPDGDGDGVNDEEDKCPTLKGTVANQGCPEVSKEVITRTAYAAKNIFFETGKATLLKKSFTPLNEVAKIMKDNPELKLAIDGHTDNVGSDALNQSLSDRRAASVRDYLIKQGVEESRITSTGYGESKPVATNNTAAGRQQNRRVEMTPSYY